MSDSSSSSNNQPPPASSSAIPAVPVAQPTTPPATTTAPPPVATTTPAPTTTTTPTPTPAATSTPATLREDLVKSAVSFLSSPNVQSADRSKKVAFLQKKGLNQAEIDEAFKRAGTTTTVAPTVTNTTTVAPVHPVSLLNKYVQYD